MGFDLIRPLHGKKVSFNSDLRRFEMDIITSCLRPKIITGCFYLQAYQNWKKRNGDEPSLPGMKDFSNEKIFFLGFAQVWQIFFYYLVNHRSSTKILKKFLVASPHSSFGTIEVIQEGPCSNSIYSWCCALEVWLTPTVHTVKWSKNDVQYNSVYNYLYIFIVHTKTVDSVFRTLWLATQSVNLLHYSLIHLQFLQAFVIYTFEPLCATTAWLAQLGEHRSAHREVTGSKPGRTSTQGLNLKNWEESTAFVMTSVMKSFEIRTKNRWHPSHSFFTYLVLVGRKGTHATVRKE